MKKYIIVSVFIAFYVFYFCMSTGLNGSNDGGHVGLAKSVYYDQEFSVEKYYHIFVFEPDYAVKEGIKYSDRLPGTSLLILPTFAYSNILFNMGLKSVTNTDFDVLIASILPPLIGVLSLVLLFVFYSSFFKIDLKTAMILTVIYGLCTLSMLESTHLYSHAPSLFLVTFSVFYAVLNRNNKNWKSQLILISIVIGLATLIELQNILFFFLITFYIIYSHRLKEKKTELIKSLVISSIIIILFISLLLMYNYVVFDDFMLKSNKYNPFFPEERSFYSALSGNFFDGLDRLYTNFGNLSLYVNPYKARLNDIPGVFVSSPVILFSLLGFVKFYKLYKPEFYLFTGCICIASIIAAMHVTTLVRHIYTVNMLSYVPIVFFVKYMLSIKDSQKKYRLKFLFIIVVLISFVRISFSTISYWGRYIEDLFLFSKELKVFFISNIPLVILLYWKKNTFKRIIFRDNDYL
jgi:hypothetical protein